MKRTATFLCLLISTMLMTGCVSLRLGTDTAPPDFRIQGAGGAYASMPGVGAYNGTIMSLSLFRGGANSGELASLRLWPIGGLDLGLLGVRLKFLPWELGAGTLFYIPRPDVSPAVDVDVEVKTGQATSPDSPVRAKTRTAAVGP